MYLLTKTTAILQDVGRGVDLATPISWGVVVSCGVTGRLRSWELLSNVSVCGLLGSGVDQAALVAGDFD